MDQFITTVSSFHSRWYYSAQEGPYALGRVSWPFPQSHSRNSTHVGLVERRSLPTPEDGSSATFYVLSFFQAISDVILWFVYSNLFYSRLCLSTAGSSPPPESSIFLCPLLSSSIPLLVSPQCHLSNDVLVFRLILHPLSATLCF